MLLMLTLQISVSVSSQQLQASMSSGELIMKFLQYLFGRRSNSFRKPRKVRARCGHETFLEGTVTVNGITVSLHCLSRKPDCCFSCLEKFATTCAFCNKLILPGTSVQAASEGKVIGICCQEIPLADCTGKWTEAGYRQVPFAELL